MVVAGDAPTVVDSLKNIRTIIVVGVPHAGDFAALGAVKPAVIVGEVEWLVQAFGVERPLDLLRFAEGVGEDVDVAAAATDSEFAVGQHLNAAGLEHDPFGDRDLVDLVVVRLDRVGGLQANRLAKRKPGQQCEVCDFFHFLKFLSVLRVYRFHS